MERKKCGSVFLFLILSFWAFSQNNYRERIYESFISGEMGDWETVLDEMEQQKYSDPDHLKELIGYQYGYIGWCLGNNKKEAAKETLSQMEKNLGKLKQQSGETADFHAFYAAAYGFKIGLSNWRAPFLGPKSMERAEQALEKAPRNFQVNLEMGNIWNHMPKVFGGSAEKAKKYYRKAIEIMENSEPGPPENNWMYLNLLALAGQMESKAGNREKALHFYQKALNIEPRFEWVKRELLPSLK